MGVNASVSAPAQGHAAGEAGPGKRQEARSPNQTGITSSEVLPYSRILELQRSGPVPLYYQLAGSLEAAVAAGSIKHGTRLPSDQEMARELKLATGTVRQAWTYLERKGTVTRAKRTGTFVL